jgi:adenosylmethionine-8-amino-7-oxononanoate aminotransferase
MKFPDWKSKLMLQTDRPIWRPYTQEKTAPLPVEIASADGAYLYTKSGRKIFDAISSWWLITHGHCHPEIVEAVQRQAARLDQVVFSNFSHAPGEELASLLVQMTPRQFSRVFFTDNGSTAVEAALKMALQACAQQGYPEKQKFLAFESAYHGDTVGAMSVSGSSPFNQPYRRTLFEVLRARHPQTSKASVDDFTCDFEMLIELHHPSLAGVILEPLIQAAGGMIVWPDAAIQKIAELCRKHQVYLIFDEVMTGFGRTGKLFAMDRLNVIPDIICLSKGLTGGTLPLAVTMVREDIYDSFLAEEQGRMFFHGHSFTGNPLSCAAAVANLKLFLRNENSRNLKAIEQIHLQKLQALKACSEFIDTRMCGTMAAIEVKTEHTGYLSNFSSRVFNNALEHGVFLRPLGNIVYFLPPYCSTEADLNSAWDITLNVIKKEIETQGSGTLSRSH